MALLALPESALVATPEPVPVSGDGGSMHTMPKRHDVQVLRRVGLSLAENLVSKPRPVDLPCYSTVTCDSEVPNLGQEVWILDEKEWRAAWRQNV